MLLSSALDDDRNGIEHYEYSWKYNSVATKRFHFNPPLIIMYKNLGGFFLSRTDSYDIDIDHPSTYYNSLGFRLCLHLSKRWNQ